MYELAVPTTLGQLGRLESCLCGVREMSLVPQDYEPVRVRLGDVSVSDTRVQTPYGAFPLARTTWMVTNQTYVTESIPAWAIVLAIIFFVFCLLGLLFLLVKERRLYGAMQVSIQGPG